MELELLEGIFQSIGGKYLEKTEPTSEQEIDEQKTQGEVENVAQSFLERRQKYLADRLKSHKEKAYRLYLPGDSGYASNSHSGCSSTTGSGYSSHQPSKSPSPVPHEVGEIERDIRERRWLVCKSGILPVRLVTKEAPDKTFKESIKQLEHGDKHVSAQVITDRTNLQLNMKAKSDVREENNNLCNNNNKGENTTSPLEEGMVEVELEDTGEVVKVESRFLEQARPKEKEVDDLMDLQILNESEILSTLSHRYTNSIYQTKLGNSLVTVNPMQQTDTVCTRSNRQRRRGHASASQLLIDQVESVYRRAVTTCTTQSLVMLGRSGAGKSCNLKHALTYLIETSQSLDTSRLNLDKMHAMDCLMESFCSTRTSMNTHATRIVELIELQFSNDGVLAGGSIELALPDTNRLIRSGRFTGEPTFPILYQVQAALGKSNLFFPPRLLNNNAFFTPLKEDMEVSTALEDWGRVCGAMELLEFGEEEQDAFWIILAVITNLGYITQCIESGETVDPVNIDKIAKLLGVQSADLNMIFSRPNTPRTITPASSIATSTSSSRTGSPGPSSSMGGMRTSMTFSSVDLSQQPNSMAENVRRLAVNLYTELLARLVRLINRSIKCTQKQQCNIFLFDSPGFQNPSTIGNKPAAGFVDLCYNYLHEKLQDMFATQKIDNLLKGKAARKMIFERRGSTKPILNILEKQGSKPEKSAGTRTLDRRGSKKVRFQNTAPGLFTLLHRAGNCPWSDDQVFLQRLTAHWSSNTPGTTSAMDRIGEEEFLLRHSIGTNPVRYCVKGWRNMSYSMGRTNLALEMLQKSSREELRIQGPIQFYPGLGISKLPLTLDQVKATMSCLQVLVQVDAIVQLLSSSEINFVFCLLPHNLAGLCELFKKSPGRKLNQKLVRDQIRGYQILDYLKASDCVRNHKEANYSPQELPDAICRIEENKYKTGLAGELWNLLQVAIINMVANLEVIEGTLTRSISLPANTISQVMEPSNLLSLDNGRISLNLQHFIS